MIGICCVTPREISFVGIVIDVDFFLERSDLVLCEFHLKKKERNGIFNTITFLF